MTGRDLRGRLMRAPWWVLALAYGVFFGGWQFVWQVARHDASPLGAAIGAVVSGAFYGLVMALATRRMRERYRTAVAGLPEGQERQARRAASRGPVPTDPRVRAAAATILDAQFASVRRLWWAIGLWVFFIALSVVLVVTDSPWWLLAVALFGGFLVFHLWSVRRLAARRELFARAAAS